MTDSMKKAWEAVSVVIILLMLAVAICGCSHNVGTGFHGQLINVGYDPETNKVGIQYYNGCLVTGVARENSESSMIFKTTSGGETGTNAKGTTTSEMTYTNKVGRQITGYYVDAIEAGAKPEDLEGYTADK